MAKKETSFSKYAQAVYETLYDSKGNKAKVVKELLMLGQTQDGKDTIKEKFPVNNSNCIEHNAADRLRKYMRGENDITEISSLIHMSFDKNLFTEEIEDFGEKVKGLAEKLNIDTNAKKLSMLRREIGEFHKSILNESSEEKRHNTQKNNNAAEDISDLSMYVITPLEKQAASNICNLIMKSLRSIKSIASTISNKTSELKNTPNTSEAYKKLRENLEFNIENLKNKYTDEFSNVNEYCEAFVTLFTNRTHLNTNIKNIYDIASNISDDRYMITSSKFDYSSLSLLVSDMGKYIERFQKFVDSLTMP